jgi:hypothetical protein
MTLTVRGRATGVTGVPAHWKEPLPDPTVLRTLPDHGDYNKATPKRGYARVPLSLLHGGYQDLGVLIWAQLRLWFDGRSDKATYAGLAAALGQDSGALTTVEHKFSNAIRPLLGSWIHRTRVGPNLFAYQAVLPDEHERFALIRRADIRLLKATKDAKQRVKPADIVDFARWQLECGSRGWTVETSPAIARRWNVTPATIRTSRRRLESLGLLEVTRRVGPGQLSEIVWLKELYDPHWEVPSLDVEDQPHRQGNRKESRQSALRSSGRKATAGEEKRQQSAAQKTDSPYLSESLADELSDLGGTSVPPLGLVTREVGHAPPPASRLKNRIGDPHPAGAHHTSVRLVRRHPVFARARPHFRAAMIARLAVALENGLAPGHADRALARVAEEGAFDAECLLLRRALQQARADQLAGMCADCGGDQDDHRRGCAEFSESWDGSPWPEQDGPGATTEVEDPLAILVRRRVPDVEDPVDGATAVEWLIVQFARQLLEVSDREARLRAIVLGLHAKAPPGQHELINQAAEHVRYALNRSLAS